MEYMYKATKDGKSSYLLEEHYKSNRRYYKDLGYQVEKVKEVPLELRWMLLETVQGPHHILNQDLVKELKEALVTEVGVVVERKVKNGTRRFESVEVTPFSVVWNELGFEGLGVASSY